MATYTHSAGVHSTPGADDLAEGHVVNVQGVTGTRRWASSG